MRTMTKLQLFLFCLLVPMSTFAAEAPNWLADTLYGSGKMNTVIAVVMILIVVLLVWMFLMDRRIKRLEKK